MNPGRIQEDPKLSLEDEINLIFKTVFHKNLPTLKPKVSINKARLLLRLNN
jgi:hypothetical protein